MNPEECYNKPRSFPVALEPTVMHKPMYWPLDFEPEDEIYDTVAWDLPGYRKASRGRHPGRPTEVRISHEKVRF